MVAFSQLLRRNIGLGSLAGLIVGTIQTLAFWWENGISPLSYPNLSWRLAASSLSAAIWISILTGVLAALLFTFPAWRKRNFAALLLRQTLFALAVLSALMLVKKYQPDLLIRPLAYPVFYVTHWVKIHFALFAGIILSLLAVSWACARNTSLERFFGLRVTGVAVFVLAVVHIATGLRHDQSQKVLSGRSMPNVILLTVDTLRADHLSIYGYPRSTTPHLDRLGRENVLFWNAVATWTKTNQSFAAILTGKYTYSTGIAERVAAFMPRHNFMIAEILYEYGYETTAFVSNANLAKYFDFHDGFQHYAELWKRERGPAREHGGTSWYDAAKVTREATAWLQKNRRIPFFLWVHYIDPHTPYTPPSPYREMFLNDDHYTQYEKIDQSKIKVTHRLGEETDPDYYVAQYDGEIRYMDDQIQIFLDVLRESGIEKNTLLIFTSDHGESFVENGLYFDHGAYVYDDCARVPLIVRFPARIPSPKVIRETVSLNSLVPTLLDYLGLPSPTPLDGTSFRALIQSSGSYPVDPVFIESGLQYGVRTETWKAIDHFGAFHPEGLAAPFQLFNLENDPHETLNLGGTGSEAEPKLKEWLYHWVAKVKKSTAQKVSPAMQEIEPETLEELRSLGYVN